MDKSLDDILDDFGHEVVNNTQLPRTLIKKTPKLQIGILVLEIFGDAMKDATGFGDFGEAFRLKLREQTGLTDESD